VLGWYIDGFQDYINNIGEDELNIDIQNIWDEQTRNSGGGIKNKQHKKLTKKKIKIKLTKRKKNKATKATKAKKSKKATKATKAKKAKKATKSTS
jgi:trehalose/maltose hydrolase-like predicted phosphorylase